MSLRSYLAALLVAALFIIASGMEAEDAVRQEEATCAFVRDMQLEELRPGCAEPNAEALVHE